MGKRLFIALSLILCVAVQKIDGDGDGGTLNCGNKDAVACKKEFIEQLNHRFQEFILNEMKKEITNVTDVFNAVINELPRNDSMAKILKASIEELKGDADKMEANKSNYEKTRAIIRNMELNLQPHVTLANLDKKGQDEFEKILDKHNYSKIMENFDFNDFIEAFTKMWLELHSQLRTIDLKEYPAYNEINHIMKTVVAEKDSTKREKLTRDAMKMVRNFCTIPFMEEVIFYGIPTKKQR